MISIYILNVYLILSSQNTGANLTVIIGRLKFRKNKGIRLLEKMRSRNKVVYNVGKATLFFFFAVRTSFFWRKTGGPRRASQKRQTRAVETQKCSSRARLAFICNARLVRAPLSFSFSRLPFRCAACDSHRVSPHSKTSLVVRFTTRSRL